MWRNIVLFLKSYMKYDKEIFYVSHFWKVIIRKVISVSDARKHIDAVISISLFSIILKMCDGDWKKWKKQKYKMPTWNIKYVITVLMRWKPKEPSCSFCLLTCLCLQSAVLMFALLLLLLFPSAYIVHATPLLFPHMHVFFVFFYGTRSWFWPLMEMSFPWKLHR